MVKEIEERILAEADKLCKAIRKHHRLMLIIFCFSLLLSVTFFIVIIYLLLKKRYLMAALYLPSLGLNGWNLITQWNWIVEKLDRRFNILNKKY